MAIAADDANSDAHEYLAEVLFDRGDLAGTEASLRKAAANPHCSVEARCKLGLLLLNNGDQTGAEAQYRLALEKDPDASKNWDKARMLDDALVSVGVTLDKDVELVLFGRKRVS